MRQRRVAMVDQTGTILNVIVFDDTVGYGGPLPQGVTLIDAPDGGEPGGWFIANQWWQSFSITAPTSLGLGAVTSSRIINPTGVSSASILNSTSSILLSSAIVIG
jgi:hypothetical protein